MLSVYELKWAGSTILDDIGDGLSNNNSSIAIHLPIFKKNFEIVENFKETKIETFAENFYIIYFGENHLERMNFNYFGLCDLVFYNKVYNGLYKNKFYTTLNLN